MTCPGLSPAFRVWTQASDPATAAPALEPGPRRVWHSRRQDGPRRSHRRGNHDWRHLRRAGAPACRAPPRPAGRGPARRQLLRSPGAQPLPGPQLLIVSAANLRFLRPRILLGTRLPPAHRGHGRRHPRGVPAQADKTGHAQQAHGTAYEGRYVDSPAPIQPCQRGSGAARQASGAARQATGMVQLPGGGLQHFLSKPPRE